MNQKKVGHFDLNIQKVLEHWTVAHAIRELLANALDESALTKASPPEIFKDNQGCWHIRDLGRGLKYEHFTQNENREKAKNPELVIGKFGVGLKDALATLDRHRIGILIKSKFGMITIEKTGKYGFEDIVTLHAVIREPQDPAMTGTVIVLENVKDEDMEKAKNFFLAYSGEKTLTDTKYGQVVEKTGKKSRIYVNGLVVAEEDNLLFSYNITSPTKRLLKALNRERTNVGRIAYADRIKSILLECTDSKVADLVANDLKHLQSGKAHDELQWIDVQLHACRILSTKEKVVFVTWSDAVQGSAHIEYAKADGYRIVVVPENLARKFSSVQDIAGSRIMDLNQYKMEWNENFKFRFVSVMNLSKKERDVFSYTEMIIQWIAGRKSPIKEVLISETMRMDASGFDARGIWEPSEKRIIIKRDQLKSLRDFTGTLLHEVVHAISGKYDGTLEFEDELTDALGMVGELIIKNSVSTKR